MFAGDISLAVDPIDAEAFTLQAERFYASLIFAMDSGEPPEPSLGGKLLYAGELDAEARALVVAANIAGAATLTASADAEARKQAMRDGVVDFLVTTLDEALRILKNEIRKRETVAVCVSQAPKTIAREMQERGVMPDILRPIKLVSLHDSQAILAWRVASMPALWLPRIDAIAADSLTLEEESARRWLRLAPRYLGRLAQGARVLRCSESTAKSLRQRVQEVVESGEIGAAVEVKLVRTECTEQHIFTC
jgi:urocanate hydratase